MKLHHRPSTLPTFLAGLGAGALIVTGVVYLTAPAAGQLPDCATEILVSP